MARQTSKQDNTILELTYIDTCKFSLLIFPFSIQTLPSLGIIKSHRNLVKLYNPYSVEQSKGIKSIALKLYMIKHAN